MRDFNTIKYLSNKYIILSLYFSNKDRKKNLIIAKIIRKVYLINNLKTNILIKNNLIDSKEITIDINNKLVFINSCDVIVLVEVKTSCVVIYTLVYVKKTITISS